jgi:hypothetical protein
MLTNKELSKLQVHMIENIVPTLLLCAYKILNPINVNEKGPCNSSSHSSKFTSLYDVVESDDMCHGHENNQIYKIL